MQKRRFTLLVLCFLLMAVAAAFVACGELTPSSGDSNCEHTYAKVVTAEPTCTETGTAVFVCDKCQHTYTETLPAKGHTYADTVVNSTCSDIGYTKHVCSICGDTHSDSYTDSLGHDYVNGVCTRCNAKEIKGHTHDYSIVTVEKAATCMDSGIEKRSCACGEYVTSLTVPTGHSYTVSVTAPACTSEGYTLHTCIKCNDSYKDTITAALGHSLSAYEVSKASTCAVKGTAVATCSICKAEVAKELALSARHTYDEGAVTLAATCTEEGVRTYTCTDCGVTKTAVIGKVSHSYGEAADGISTCANCGNTKKVLGDKSQTSSVISVDTISSVSGDTAVKDVEIELSHASVVIDPATLEQFALAGGALELSVLPAEQAAVTEAKKALSAGDLAQIKDANILSFSAKLGVDAVSEFEGKLSVTIPYTLSADDDPNALTVWYLGANGLVKIENSVYSNGFVTFETTHFSYYFAEIEETSCEVVGHAYVKTVVPATCSEKGYTVSSCSKCGKTTIGEYRDALKHEYEGKVKKAADCTHKGVKEYICTKCGNSYVEELSATGHNAVKDAPLAAGCVTSGLTAGSHCTLCGEVFVKQTVITAIGHDFTSKVTKEATETEAGEITYSCSRCDYSYQEVIAAIGIKYDEGTITRAATCTEKGEKTFTALSGTASYTEEIPALGHDFVNHDAIAPTCTEDGCREYVTCSRCDYTNKAAVAALGHKYERKTDSPTCTADGLATYVCSACSHSYTEVLPASGHVDGNGDCYCDKCATYLNEGLVKVSFSFRSEIDLGYTYLSSDLFADATVTPEELIEGRSAEFAKLLKDKGFDAADLIISSVTPVSATAYEVVFDSAKGASDEVTVSTYINGDLSATETVAFVKLQIYLTSLTQELRARYVVDEVTNDESGNVKIYCTVKLSVMLYADGEYKETVDFETLDQLNAYLDGLSSVYEQYAMTMIAGGGGYQIYADSKNANRVYATVYLGSDAIYNSLPFDDVEDYEEFADSLKEKYSDFDFAENCEGNAYTITFTEQVQKVGYLYVFADYEQKDVVLIDDAVQSHLDRYTSTYEDFGYTVTVNYVGDDIYLYANKLVAVKFNLELVDGGNVISMDFDTQEELVNVVKQYLYMGYTVADETQFFVKMESGKNPISVIVVADKEGNVIKRFEIGSAESMEVVRIRLQSLLDANGYTVSEAVESNGCRTLTVGTSTKIDVLINGELVSSQTLTSETVEQFVKNVKDQYEPIGTVVVTEGSGSISVDVTLVMKIELVVLGVSKGTMSFDNTSDFVSYLSELLKTYREYKVEMQKASDGGVLVNVREKTTFSCTVTVTFPDEESETRTFSEADAYNNFFAELRESYPETEYEFLLITEPDSEGADSVMKLTIRERTDIHTTVKVLTDEGKELFTLQLTAGKDDYQKCVTDKLKTDYADINYVIVDYKTENGVVTYTVEVREIDKSATVTFVINDEKAFEKKYETAEDLNEVFVVVLKLIENCGITKEVSYDGNNVSVAMELDSYVLKVELLGEQKAAVEYTTAAEFATAVGELIVESLKNDISAKVEDDVIEIVVTERPPVGAVYVKVYVLGELTVTKQFTAEQADEIQPYIDSLEEEYADMTMKVIPSNNDYYVYFNQKTVVIEKYFLVVETEDGTELSKVECKDYDELKDAIGSAEDRYVSLGYVVVSNTNLNDVTTIVVKLAETPVTRVNVKTYVNGEYYGDISFETEDEMNEDINDYFKNTYVFEKLEKDAEGQYLAYYVSEEYNPVTVKLYVDGKANSTTNFKSKTAMEQSLATYFGEESTICFTEYEEDESGVYFAYFTTGSDQTFLLNVKVYLDDVYSETITFKSEDKMNAELRDYLNGYSFNGVTQTDDGTYKASYSKLITEDNTVYVDVFVDHKFKQSITYASKDAMMAAIKTLFGEEYRFLQVEENGSRYSASFTSEPETTTIEVALYVNQEYYGKATYDSLDKMNEFVKNYFFSTEYTFVELLQDANGGYCAYFNYVEQPKEPQITVYLYVDGIYDSQTTFDSKEIMDESIEYIFYGQSELDNIEQVDDYTYNAYYKSVADPVEYFYVSLFLDNEFISQSSYTSEEEANAAAPTLFGEGYVLVSIEPLDNGIAVFFETQAEVTVNE